MFPNTAPKPKRSRASTSSTFGSQAPQKTEITINVYDLLPPGRLSTLLWTLGTSLLHTGVQISSREYAYGGHNHRNTTGVYYTRPRFEPPGGTFRCAVLQGFTFQPPEEIDKVVKEVSEEFLGERYNLLTNNCNHFTSALCERLTGKPAPAWLNRAAGIGLALPCMVPREWVDPPDCETVGGELLDEGEEEEDYGSEREDTAMLGRDRRKLREGRDWDGRGMTPPPRLVSVRDTSGRQMPVAERAPLPKKAVTWVG